MKTTRLKTAWLICLLAILALGTALFGVQGLQRVDAALYDLALHVDARAPHPDVVIVAVDPPSLEQVGRWPWSRALQAQLVDKVAQAKPKGVAVDVIYAEPSAPAEKGAQEDLLLAQALTRLREQGSRVVLPVLLQETQAASEPPAALRPIPLIEQAASQLGHIHVQVDSDAVVRGLYLAEGPARDTADASQATTAEAAPWPALSAQLVQPTGLPIDFSSNSPSKMAKEHAVTSDWPRYQYILLPFSGGVGHYRSIPASTLLRGEVPPEYLRDKWVLLGLTATGLGDHYPTPFSGKGALIPGIEIHAAAVDALLTQRWRVPASRAAQGLAGVALLVVWMLALWRWSPRVSLWGSLALTALVLAWSVLAFWWLRLWWPPATWIVTGWVAYVLWNWRRLAVLMEQLDECAALLGVPASGAPLSTHAPAQVSINPFVQGAQAWLHDGWERIINALEIAVQTRLQRDQALQWLSHDIRAPQSAIVALLRSAPMRGELVDEHLRTNIEAQVNSTLTLANDFVLRLQADMPPTHWRDVELGQLLYEIRERALPLARERNIDLQLLASADGSGEPGEQGEQGYWVHTDPQLLDRAIFNLVDNAIKYGREGGWVKIAVDWLAPVSSAVSRSLALADKRAYQKRPYQRYLQVSVADNGEGISAQDQTQLFQPHSRFNTNAHNQGTRPLGHGLGLSLVKAVAQSHQGSINCHSVLGEGTVFELVLPAAMLAEG